MQPPAGYARGTAGDATFYAPHDDLPFVAGIIASTSLYQYAAQQATAQQSAARSMSGRAAVHVLATPRDTWVVRHYQRGGAMAGLMGDRYVGTAVPRPFAELLVSEQARARGIATPQVTAAVVYAAGMFYRGDLATSYIDNASDLAALSLSDDAWALEERVAAWRAAGAMLRMCFETGLVHPDLNLKNILVQRTKTGLVAHVIDLDRAYMDNSLSKHRRMRMLQRFDRSRLKIERSTNRTVTPDEQRALREGLHA
jgi:3-deoxy-D-manno-octulosonic acid kinase